MHARTPETSWGREETDGEGWEEGSVQGAVGDATRKRYLSSLHRAECSVLDVGVLHPWNDLLASIVEGIIDLRVP